MPFITQDRRDIIDAGGLYQNRLPGGIQPGDLCYKYYKAMMDEWKDSPRWTTAHNIYLKGMAVDDLFDDDHIAAYSLAWEVFFHFYVIPYEEEKRKLNGDI